MRSAIALPPAACLLGSLVLAACTGPPLPPVTPSPSGESHPGKFVWFDLLSEDAARARAFYGHVFGWNFEPLEDVDDYFLIRNGGSVIGGIAQIDDRQTELPESRWLATLSVEDVDAATALVQDASGKVLMGARDVPGRGRMAVVRDPAGAPLVLLRAAGGDPPDAGHPVGDFLWTDFVTRDAADVASFYAALVGYESKDIESGQDHVYHVLGRDGRARAGLVELPGSDVEPNWLPYVRVADLDATLARVVERGGRVLLRRDSAAVLIDPMGAAIGVQYHGRLGAAK